jgi:hypothetical protein
MTISFAAHGGCVGWCQAGTLARLLAMWLDLRPMVFGSTGAVLDPATVKTPGTDHSRQPGLVAKSFAVSYHLLLPGPGGRWKFADSGALHEARGSSTLCASCYSG